MAVSWKSNSIIADLYEVKGLAGRGGMGTVHRVHHLNWNIDLAVKTPSPKVLKKVGGAKQFQEREAYQWVRLGLHPNIASCFYVRTLDDGIPRLFIEFVEGGSLKEWMKQDKIPDLVTALDIGIQICWGVSWAHKRGLAHLDIKPENVLMTLNGTPKITDFGLVKAADSPLSEVESGGTPGYAAPEQIRKESDISTQSDVYALGVLLYELLGRFINLQAFPQASAGARPAFYAKELKNRGDTLSKILKRSMEYSPKERYQNAALLGEALTEAYETIVSVVYSRQVPRDVQIRAGGLNNLALSLHDLDKPEEAYEVWKEAQEMDPANPIIIYNKGLLEWRMGLITDDVLVGHLESACSNHPNDWNPIFLLAQVHLERQDYQAALENLNRIKGKDTEREEVIHLAEAIKDRPDNSLQCLRVFEGHTGGVNAVCLSGDNRMALSGSNDATIRQWEVKTGKFLRVLAYQGGVGISAKFANTDGGLSVKEFDGFMVEITSLCMSKDGRLAISGHRDGLVRLWDLKKGSILLDFMGHDKKVIAVCLSTDKKIALSGSFDGIVRVWDVGSGQCIDKLEAKEHNGPVAPVCSVCMSQDDRFALSSYVNGNIRLWDLKTGKCVKTVTGRAGPLMPVCLNTDGNFAVSGDSEHNINLWDLQKGALVKTFKVHSESIWSLCFSPDEGYLLSGGETLRLWDIKAGRCFHTYKGHTGYITSVCFSSNGEIALTGSIDGSLRLWNTCLGKHAWQSQNLLVKVSDSAKASVNQAGYEKALKTAREALNAGNVIAAAHHIRKARSEEGYERAMDALRLWRTLYAQLHRTQFIAGWTIATHEEQDTKTAGGMWNANVEKGTVQISEDGNLALFNNHSTFNILDTQTGKCLRSFKQPNVSFNHTGTAGYLSSNGCLVLIKSNRNLELWDAKTGEPLRTFTGHKEEIVAFHLCRNNRIALSGDKDNMIYCWDVNTGERLRTLKLHTSGTITGFGADGQFVLCRHHDFHEIWSIRTGECIGAFKDAVQELYRETCLSGDGNLLLTGGRDGVLVLWNVQDGRRLRVLKGHIGAVNTICLSMDGKLALSGSDDRTIRMWNVKTGECMHTFEGNKGAVTCVNISADNGLVISRSGVEMRTWFLDWELENKETVDWDEEAQPTIDGFIDQLIFDQYLFQQTSSPKGDDAHLLSEEVVLTDNEIFQQLRRKLNSAGYGWLNLNDIQRELRKQISIRNQAQTNHQKYMDHARKALSDGKVIDAAQYVRKARGEEGSQHGSDVLELWRSLYTELPQTQFLSSQNVAAFGKEFTIGQLEGISLDGNIFLTQLGSDTDIYNLRTGEKIIHFYNRRSSNKYSDAPMGHTSPAKSWCLSASGSIALSGGEDHTLRLWDVQTGKCTRIFKGHNDQVLSVCMSLNGRLALSGSQDNALRLWDVQTGRCMQTLRGHTGAVTSVCLSADGRFALSKSTDNTIRVWETKPGVCGRIFKEQINEESVACLGASGNALLVGNADHVLRLLDAQTGECIRVLKGHKGRIASVCLSLDGHTALSGGSDSTLRLWDLRKGECVHIFEVPARRNSDTLYPGKVDRIYISADNHIIVASTDGRIIRKWYVDWELEKKPANWDAGALPFLRNFVALHTHSVLGLFQRAKWTEEDFNELLNILAWTGYHWLHPEEVRLKLEEMTQKL